jgi:hypothetical protein
MRERACPSLAMEGGFTGRLHKVRAAYNYAQHLPERRKMMRAWADYLDALKADEGAKVIPIKRRAKA